MAIKNYKGNTFAMFYQQDNVKTVLKNAIVMGGYTKKELRKVLKEAAWEVLELARELAPVDTGYLMNSAFVIEGQTKNRSEKIVPYKQAIPNNEKTRKRKYFWNEKAIGGARRFVKTREKKGHPTMAVGFAAGHFSVVHEVHKTQSLFLQKAYLRVFPNTKLKLKRRLNQRRIQKEEARLELKNAVLFSNIRREARFRNGIATEEDYVRFAQQEIKRQFGV